MRLLFLLSLLCLAGYSGFSQDCNNYLGKLKFSGYRSKLTKEAKHSLRDIAGKIKINPGCYISITGYCGITENSQLNESNWNRINNTINHLVKKEGLLSDRFIFRYGADNGDCHTIEFSFTTDTLPANSPPHPNLRRQ